jgi:ribonuclease BN (tRNA processing enzyme)
VKRVPVWIIWVGNHEVTPMPDQMLSPKRIAAEAFTDAAAAVARIAEIYERNVAFLRATFEAYVGGEPLDGRVRATYPFVRITTGTHARLDSRLSYGFVSGPGIYESSVTRPDLFSWLFHRADRASHPEPWRAGEDRRIGRTDPERAFAAEPSVSKTTLNGVLCDERTCRVSAAILEHRTPCLGFALQEAAHVNIWKNRLSERGLPVGPWLRWLKKAVVEGRADDFFIWIDGAATSDGRLERLGSLRDLLTVTAGQKIAYVTDVADTPANRAAIVALVQNADILFIEAAFAGADAALARERAHLTTTAAGVIAREANVRRVEPFHFSPRYAGEQERMLAEVMTAFQGSHA